MFRFEDNVASYLVNESRDFQMMCRLYDLLYMGQRSDISTMQDLNVPTKCKSNVLHLLAEKVGFFSDEYIDENVLRNIISAFRICVKKKGTIEAVKTAVIAVLKAENTLEQPTITYISSTGKGVVYKPTGQVEVLENTTYPAWERSKIIVETSVKIRNLKPLQQFLRYIIPFGFTFSIRTLEKEGE